MTIINTIISIEKAFFNCRNDIQEGQGDDLPEKTDQEESIQCDTDNQCTFRDGESVLGVEKVLGKNDVEHQEIHEYDFQSVEAFGLVGAQPFDKALVSPQEQKGKADLEFNALIKSENQEG